MSNVYLGKVVSTKNFRVFVYGYGDEQRLCDNWEEYQKAIGSGIWFAEKPKKEEKVEEKKRVVSKEEMPTHSNSKKR